MLFNTSFIYQSDWITFLSLYLWVNPSPAFIFSSLTFLKEPALSYHRPFKGSQGNQKAVRKRGRGGGVGGQPPNDVIHQEINDRRMYFKRPSGRRGGFPPSHCFWFLDWNNMERRAEVCSWSRCITGMSLYSIRSLHCTSEKITW